MPGIQTLKWRKKNEYSILLLQILLAGGLYMQQLLIWPCEACQEMFKLHGTNEYVRANGRCQCLFVEEFQPTPKSSLQSDLFGYLVIPFGSNGRTLAIDPDEYGGINLNTIRRVFRRNL